MIAFIWTHMKPKYTEGSDQEFVIVEGESSAGEEVSDEDEANEEVSEKGDTLRSPLVSRVNSPNCTENEEVSKEEVSEKENEASEKEEKNKLVCFVQQNDISAQKDEEKGEKEKKEKLVCSVQQSHASGQKLVIKVDNRENRKIKSEMFNNILDHNEAFKDLEIKVEYLQMTTADFSICYNEHILLLIERKSLKDLGQTLKDSSRRFNYRKMLNVKEASPHCLGVYYLIEGPRMVDRKSKYSRVAASSLITHLDHLMFSHGIHVIYSKNPSDSVYRILELTRNISNMHDPNPIKAIDSEMGEAKSGGEANKTLTARQDLDKDAVKMLLWSSIRGVSATLAGMLMDHNIDIKNMILGNISASQIQAIRYPGGCPLGKRSRNLIKKMTSITANKDAASKFISAIPGVSKNTAGIILDHISIEDIFELKKENEGDVDRIANIRMTKKRKMGKSIANKIIQFIT